MKKLILLFFILSTIKLSAIEDSCLAFVWEDCRAFLWDNPYNVLKDTCSGKNEYYSHIFSFYFQENVFNFTGKPDEKIIFNYQEIDSIWKNLPPKFTKMKAYFEKLFIEYGNFYLEKVHPEFTDSNNQDSRFFYLKFDNYHSVSKINSIFYEVDNIYSFGLILPDYCSESYRLSLHLISNSYYPEFNIINTFNYTSWCEDSLDIEIFRKSSHDKNFNLLKKIYPKKIVNYHSFFEVNFLYTDTYKIIPGETYYYKAKAHAIPQDCYSPFSNISSITIPLILGDTTACQNDLKTYSSTAYPDFQVWWKVTNGQIKSSPFENMVVVSWDNIGIGTLELFRIGRDTSILNINVNPLPPKPTIIRKGDSLYSKTDYDTRWYCDGSIVDSYNGKKAIQLRYDREHYYTVMQIGQNNCSSEMSELFYFDPYSSDKEEISKSLIVLPNPASDNISISFQGGINQSIHI